MTAGRSSGAAAMALFVHSGAPVQPQQSCFFYIMYLLPECMSFLVLCILNRQNLQPQRYCRGLPVRKNLTAKNVKKGTYSVHEKSIDFMNGI